MTLDPTTLAGKRLWLRAKDAGANGASVTTWADQSGNGNDATCALTLPTVADGSTPGGGKSLALNKPRILLPDLGMSTDGEMWIVVKSASEDTDATRIPWKFGTDVTAAANNYYGYGGAIQDDFGTTTRLAVTPVADLTQWKLYRIWITDDGAGVGTRYSSLDGSQIAAVANSTVAWASEPRLSGRKTQSGGFVGNYAEVLVRDTVSTADEVAWLIDYFNTEHGLSVPGGASPATAPVGAGSGAFVWSGSASGAKIMAGVAAGAFAFAGASAGVAVHGGAAVGAHLWVGEASGVAPVVGSSNGYAEGLFSWDGSAVGKAIPAGFASGAFTWDGAAVGSAASTAIGTASGAFDWSGTAAGDNGNPLPGSFGWVGSNTSTAVVGYVEHPAAVAPPAIVERVLMRQSHQMPVPAPDANGRYRSDGTYPIVEASVGTLHAWVDGVDVTYLRDVPTGFGSMRSSLPGADETASIEFPQVHPFDARDGDLAPLHEDAPVEVAIMREDGSRIHLFAGHLVSDNINQGPTGNSETWHVEGTLQQADHVGHAVPVALEQTEIGKLIPDALNGVVSRRYPRIPRVTTGITSQKRGSYGDKELDYVSDLLASAWTVGGQQWTIARTGTPRKFELVLKDTTTIHHVVTAAAPGIAANLTEDHAERVDVIYGRGVGSDGYSWAGWHFPGFHDYDPPDYPYPSASTMMTIGSTGGVAQWRTRMRELGYAANSTGAFGTADRDIAKAFQSARGIKVDGVVGPQTWNETWNLGTHNLQAPIRLPLAWRPEVAPVLYDDSGVVLGPNPAYDAGVIRHELDIDYGPGVTKAEATQSAERQLARDMVPGWAGTITLETCPWYTSRWEIFEGQNIKLLGWRGQDLILHVVEVTKDPQAGTVTVTVDTKARDAMTLSSVLKRDRESKADPARRPGAVNRRSRQEQDMAVEFDGESPAGRIPRIALFEGLWTVWTIPLSQVGTLAKVLLTTDTPKAEFAAGLFGKPITSNILKSLVGNPLGDSEAWTRNLDSLEDNFGYVTSWGNSSEAAGHYPGTGDDPVTGRLVDTGGVEYVSLRPPWVWVALYSPTSTFIGGRLLPGPVT